MIRAIHTPAAPNARTPGDRSGAFAVLVWRVLRRRLLPLPRAAVHDLARINVLLEEVTAVRLKVEQIQLVQRVWVC